MFNDRDLGVVGLAAAAAVICLLLPVSFAWKAAIGLGVLVLGMVAAFLRLGRDGLTIENWLVRRIRFALRPKAWVYREKDLPILFRKPKFRKPAADPVGDGSVPPPVPDPKPLRFRMEFGSVPVERFASLLLIVIGFYFTAWLWADGAAAIGFDLEMFLP